MKYSKLNWTVARILQILSLRIDCKRDSFLSFLHILQFSLFMVLLATIRVTCFFHALWWVDKSTYWEISALIPMASELLKILFICDLFNDAVSSLAYGVERIFLLTQTVSNTTVLATPSKTFSFFYFLSNTSHGVGVHLCFFCVLCYTAQQTPSDGPDFHLRRAKRFRNP